MEFPAAAVIACFSLSLSLSISPVQSDIVPEDQVVITLVTNGSSTAGLQPAVVRELSNLTEKFECQFTRVERFGKLHFSPRQLNSLRSTPSLPLQMAVPKRTMLSVKNLKNL